MADFDSQLPVRSESDGTDERLHVKIVDGTSPAVNQATVDGDKNLHIEAHGNNPAGGDEVLRTSELGSASVDGIYDASNNTDPSQVGVIGLVRNASPADSQQTLRVTAKANTGGDVRSLDISLHDENGEPYSSTNPIPVSVEESEGDEKHDHALGSGVAVDGTSNHTYSVASGKTFYLYQILAAASGKLKIELQIGDGAVSEVFATKSIRFNSTANPQCDINLAKPIEVVGTVNTTTIKLIRTNRDNSAQDLSTTIVGVEF